jgi:hypothetical protein
MSRSSVRVVTLLAVLSVVGCGSRAGREQGFAPAKQRPTATIANRSTSPLPAEAALLVLSALMGEPGLGGELIDLKAEIVVRDYRGERRFSGAAILAQTKNFARVEMRLVGCKDECCELAVVHDDPRKQGALVQRICFAVTAGGSRKLASLELTYDLRHLIYERRRGH